MAKPTKYADLICAICSVVVVLGILLGLWLKSPIVLVFALAPSVVYEVYRTEGESTRWASWVMLGVLLLELVLVIFRISFDVAGFLGTTQQNVAGYDVPLGDVKIVGPALMAVLSLILIVRTRGRYTRWLAVNILVGVIALALLVDPEVGRELLRQGAQEGLDSLN